MGFLSDVAALHLPASFGPFLYIGTIVGLKVLSSESTLGSYLAWFFSYLTGGTLEGARATSNYDLDITYKSILRANLLVWFVLYTFVHAFAYWLPTRKFVHHLKINQEYPGYELVFREFIRSKRGLCIGSVLEYALYSAYGLERTSLALSGGVISATSIAMFGALIYAWGDTHFYWTHRLLHMSPWLYKNVHKVHHESFNPDPYSGLSMHPIESAVYFSSGVMLAPLVVAGMLPMWAARLLCKALIISPLDGHHGFGIRESLHYLHHTKFNYNYGSTSFWDWQCGTLLRSSADLRTSKANANKKKN